MIILAACGHNEEQLPHTSAMVGLASAVRLPLHPPATVYVTDYVPDPSGIDSLTVDSPFTLVHDTASHTVSLSWPAVAPPFALLHIWQGGSAESVPLIRSDKRVATIAYKGTAKDLRLKGEFTGWVAESVFKPVADGFEAQIDLDPGNYQYLLVAEGREMLDPANPDSVDNGIGGFNSLLRVPGTELSMLPHLSANGTEADALLIGLRGETTGISVLWQNRVLPPTAWTRDENGIRVNIPKAAGNLGRSHVRIWAWNDHGLANDLLIPLEKGKVVTDAGTLQRTDFHTAQMYFMMVDRFVNGDTTNDDPVADKEIHPRANYQGGDLAGILQVMGRGYFDSLSVNTLWVSPITQNPLKGHVEFPAPHRKYSGYHGYWPVANTVVDHRFGDDAVISQLVDATHASGRNIILDFVSNHVHEDHPMVMAHPEWRTQLDLPDGRKNIRLWDEYRLTTWFDTFIPSLDHSVPQVTQMLSDTALLWVRDRGFDGFRHDAAKHIPQEFWRELTRKLKREVVVGQGRPVLQMGETFGSRELIASYIGSGMMDGKFDFNLYFDARSVFSGAEHDFARLAASLRATLATYGHHHLMGNITGNHDLPRFISYASGDLKFGEDEKEAGWNRDIQVSDTIGYLRLRQLTAFMWTIPGIPVMYYGDEFGMPGAGDPDNRRMMRFDLNPNERATLSVARTLAALRKKDMALLYGDVDDLKADGPLLSYSRNYLGHRAVVLINADSTDHSFDVIKAEGLSTNFGSTIAKTAQGHTVNVKAHGFEVLTGH